MRSVLPPEELKKRAVPVLLLNAAAISSIEEVRLAAELARRSFRQRRNVARRFLLELLLWLSGKTDIKSALHAWGVGSSEDLLLLAETAQPELLKKLQAERIPLRLKRRASWKVLERISLGRILD